MPSAAARILSAVAPLLLAACVATPEDTSGLRVVRRTPDEFCRGTARSVAIDRYHMKKNGMPLEQAVESNGGVAVIDAITRAIYSRQLGSEAQAADAGTAACLGYFG